MAGRGDGKQKVESLPLNEGEAPRVPDTWEQINARLISMQSLGIL